MDDPCDALSTATISGDVYVMIGATRLSYAHIDAASDPCDDWPVGTVGAHVMIHHRRYDADNQHCGTSFTSLGRATWLTDNARQYIAVASGDADPFPDHVDRRWFPVNDDRTRPHHHRSPIDRDDITNNRVVIDHKRIADKMRLNSVYPQIVGRLSRFYDPNTATTIDPPPLTNEQLDALDWRPVDIPRKWTLEHRMDRKDGDE